MRVRRMLAVLAVTTLTAGVAVVAMGGAPSGAAETSGYTIIWTDGGCQLATIDLATAEVVAIGATSQSSCVSDLAVSPTGTLYGTENQKNDGLDAVLVQFDTTTGAPTTLGSLTGNFEESFFESGGITFGADDTMLVHMFTDEAACGGAAICLYRVDPTTLAATLVGPPTIIETEFNYLTAACSGTTLSTIEEEQAPPAETDTVNDQDFDQILTSWNTSTGAATEGAELLENLDVAGIEFDRVSGTLYLLGFEDDTPPPPIDPVSADATEVDPQITDTATLYTVDVATGTITAINAVPDDELAVDSLAIPGRCIAPAIELQPRFTG